MWSPKYEIFDLAFSPETEDGPQCSEEGWQKELGTGIAERRATPII